MKQKFGTNIEKELCQKFNRVRKKRGQKTNWIIEKLIRIYIDYPEIVFREEEELRFKEYKKKKD